MTQEGYKKMFPGMGQGLGSELQTLKGIREVLLRDL